MWYGYHRRCIFNKFQRSGLVMLISDSLSLLEVLSKIILFKTNACVLVSSSFVVGSSPSDSIGSPSLSLLLMITLTLEGGPLFSFYKGSLLLWCEIQRIKIRRVVLDRHSTLVRRSTWANEKGSALILVLWKEWLLTSGSLVCLSTTTDVAVTTVAALLGASNLLHLASSSTHLFSRDSSCATNLFCLSDSPSIGLATSWDSPTPEGPLVHPHSH